MKDHFQGLYTSDFENVEGKQQQALLTGVSFVFFNILLMLFVGFYWINPSVHQYITGKPL